MKADKIKEMYSMLKGEKKKKRPGIYILMPNIKHLSGILEMWLLNWVKSQDPTAGAVRMGWALLCKMAGGTLGGGPCMFNV